MEKEASGSQRKVGTKGSEGMNEVMKGGRNWNRKEARKKRKVN